MLEIIVIAKTIIAGIIGNIKIYKLKFLAIIWQQRAKRIIVIRLYHKIIIKRYIRNFMHTIRVKFLESSKNFRF